MTIGSSWFFFAHFFFRPSTLAKNCCNSALVKLLSHRLNLFEIFFFHCFLIFLLIIGWFLITSSTSFELSDTSSGTGIEGEGVAGREGVQNEFRQSFKVTSSSISESVAYPKSSPSKPRGSPSFPTYENWDCLHGDHVPCTLCNTSSCLQ